MYMVPRNKHAHWAKMLMMKRAHKHNKIANSTKEMRTQSDRNRFIESSFFHHEMYSVINEYDRFLKVADPLQIFWEFLEYIIK